MDTEKLQYEGDVSIGSEISPFDELALKTILSSFGRNNLKILEVGSWVGLGSTKIFVDYSEKLVCADSWKGNNIDQHNNVVSQIDPYCLFLNNTKHYSEKIISIRGLTSQTLDSLAKNYFDIIFIDADHTYNGVKKDIQLAMPLLKRSGILVGHDCEANYSSLNRNIKNIIRNNLNVDAIDSPIEKFRHMHCGVIKALMEENLVKSFFCDKALTLSSGQRGYSSIWVAKKKELFFRNQVFRKIKNFIKS